MAVRLTGLAGEDEVGFGRIYLDAVECEVTNLCDLSPIR